MSNMRLKHIFKAVFVIIFISFGTLLFGQEIPTGTWRTHLVYYNTESVAIADEKIYCASQNGFFFYDTEEEKINVLTKLDGLSDTEINDLEFVEATNQLIIAYENGNIDLLDDRQIINIRTILNAPFQDKILYSVKVVDQIAYFSLSFGVIKYDLEALEVLETYANLGENGGQIDVYDLELTEDSIYIVTNEGLKVASNDPLVNKQDFENWDLVLATDIINPFTHIERSANEVIILNHEMLLEYTEGMVDTLYNAVGTEELFSVKTLEGQIYLSSSDGVSIYEDYILQEKLQDEIMMKPLDLDIDVNGELWIADNEAGLLNYQEEDELFIPFFPSGPLTNDAFKVRYIQDKLVVLRGGVENGNALGRAAAFYVFQDGEWTNYTSEPNVLGGIIIPDVKDLCDAVYNPLNDKVYITSFGNGLLEWDMNTQEVRSITNAPFGVEDAFLFGVVVDGAGTVWTATKGRVHALFLDGTWQNFLVPTLSQPYEILLSFRNELWIREKNGGILVFKNGETTWLNEDSREGGLPSNNVLSMELDREGDVWIGTDEGVAEIFAVFDVFNDEIDAFKPIYNEGELLSDFPVSAIAIDGGNREWLGTNSGLWLFSDGGTALEQFFNVEESPLPSNQITSLDLNDQTGELMVITDKGMVSYRTRSTVGGAKHGNVKIFPNPVTPDFLGELTINGLVEDAFVKITDVRGQLIFEGNAFGGTFTWDLKDYNGRRPNSGVYLVFSSNETGEENYIGKFSFIK